MLKLNKTHNIDCLIGLKGLEDCSVNTIVTSPPYNKKGLSGKTKVGNQIWKKFNIDYSSYGDDMNEEDYQFWQTQILDECFRVLKDDGSLFYNHKMRRKDNVCYNPYDIVSQTPFKLYQLIIWNRKNSPNVRKDHLTPTTEYIFWLVKGKPKVFKDQIPKEFRSEVWEISPIKQTGHPAPFHPLIPELCIKLTTEEGDLVLDPFMGSGTVAKKCEEFGRNWIGFEIDKSYIKNKK
jgi:modification methylase